MVVRALLLVILALVIPPTPNHFVTDNTGALSESARASIENELHAYETATGHQVIVWIGQSTGDTPLETYTGDAAHEWRVGRRGKDDGAILFLFMGDHKVRIEVGYGLEGSLTDADSSRIIRDDIVPRMKAGDTDGAVSAGVAAMLKTITPDYSGVTPPPAQSSSGSGGGTALPVAVFALAFVLFIAFFVWVVISQSRRAKRYGGAVKSGGGSSSSGSTIFSSSSSDNSFSSSDDDFDAGGGDFGGGGASGSW